MALLWVLPQFPILRNIADEYLLVPIETDDNICNSIVTVNETIAFLWDRLIKGADEESLIVALTEEYEVSADTAKEDVISFLKSFMELGLITKE